MISLDTAQALKEAGLEWERGAHGPVSSNQWTWKEDSAYKDLVWYPRLGQMLAEIERRGYRWQADSQNDSSRDYSVIVISQKQPNIYQRFWSEFLDEAAAQGLLWILA